MNPPNGPLQSTMDDRSIYNNNSNDFDSYYGNPQDRVDDEERDFSDQSDRIERELANYREGLTVNTQKMIDQLGEVYKFRKSDQEAVTKRNVKGAEAAGFRSGLSQYASRLQGDIVSEKERVGLDALKRLDVEEKQEVLKAEMARADKDYGAFNAAMDKIRGIRKEKNSAVGDIYKSSLEYDDYKSGKQKDLAESYANALYEETKGFDKTQRDNFINSMADKLGIDPYVLSSAVYGVANSQKKSAGSGGGGYTSLELRKLRQKGIDPNNTDDADNYLYGDEEDGATFTLEMSQELAQEFEDAGLDTNIIINLQNFLNQGYTIDQILSNNSSLSEAQKELIRNSVSEV